MAKKYLIIFPLVFTALMCMGAWQFRMVPPPPTAVSRTGLQGEWNVASWTSAAYGTIADSSGYAGRQINSGYAAKASKTGTDAGIDYVVASLTSGEGGTGMIFYGNKADFHKDLGNEFTISTKCNLSNYYAQMGYGQEWRLDVGALRSGHKVIGWTDGAYGLQDPSDVDITDSAWHTIVVTRSRSSGKVVVWMDGAIKFQNTGLTLPDLTSTPSRPGWHFFWGCDAATPQVTKFNFIRCWNRILHDAECRLESLR